MMYAQITKDYSINEIVKTLSANRSKLYHSGISETKKSTFADALSKRNADIFKDVFLLLLSTAKNMFNGTRRFRDPLKIIDASRIDLCLSRFDWAHFRKAKGAIKLHMSFDSDSSLPNELFITNGKIHESNTLLDFDRKNGDIFVFDKGYNSYKSFWEFNMDGVSFITRLKSNAVIQHKVSRKIKHQRMFYRIPGAFLQVKNERMNIQEQSEL